LIIVGVATHNSVESTARTAGNLGFDAWVAEDACFTFDKADLFRHLARSAEEVHAMSLGNLHGEYATVVSTARILAGWLEILVESTGPFASRPAPASDLTAYTAGKTGAGQVWERACSRRRSRQAKRHFARSLKRRGTS
jgi:hypothetical protein